MSYFNGERIDEPNADDFRRQKPEPQNPTQTAEEIVEEILSTTPLHFPIGQLKDILRPKIINAIRASRPAPDTARGEIEEIAKRRAKGIMFHWNQATLTETQAEVIILEAIKEALSPKRGEA